MSGTARFSAVILWSLLVSLVSPSFTVSATEPPACPLDGGIVVEFEDGRLRSDLEEVEATSSRVSVEIPAGTYEVVLVSWDALSKEQPREQWHLQGLRGGEVVFSSPSTPDLPDDQDLLVSSVGTVEIPDLEVVQARHSAFPDESNPNSVEALCAGFRLVAEPVPRADLALTKEDSRDPVPVGEDFEYRLTIVNQGPDAAADVVLVDTLPLEVAYLGDDSSCRHDGSSTGGTVTCRLGDLGVGESRSVVILVHAERAAASALNRALVEAVTDDPEPDDNQDEETTELVETLSVSVDKTNDADGDGEFSQRETLVVPADQSGLVGDVAFRLVVTNTSRTVVRVRSLIDEFEAPSGPTRLSVCPDLSGAVIGVGETISCDFTITEYRPARGASQANTVSVEVVEEGDEENRASASDDSVVDFVKILPGEKLALTVEKTNDADGDGRYSDEETVRIPAGRALRSDVPFRVTIINQSEVGVVLEALTDTFGTTTIDVCPSLVGNVLASGASLICDFTIEDYEPGPHLSRVNTSLAMVAQVDDPDTTAVAQDTSTVRFTRVDAVTTTTTSDTLPFTGPGAGTSGRVAVALLLLGLAVFAAIGQPAPRSIRSTDWVND